MDESVWDTIPNDLLMHMMSYCLAHTDVRFVCRRFFNVYQKYNLARLVSRELFADYLINYTTGIVDYIGFKTTPTQICFGSKPVSGVRDAYGTWHHLVDQTDTTAAWVSASNHLHVAILQPEFRIADVMDLRPMLKVNKTKKAELRLFIGETTLVAWNALGFCAVFKMDRETRKLDFKACSTIASHMWLNIVGRPEKEILAVAAGSKGLQFLDTASLTHADLPSNWGIQHPAFARRVGDDGDMIVATRGSVALTSDRSWASHEVMRVSETGTIIWKADVVPNAETRLPGMRSSGICLRLLKRCALAVASSAVLDLRDGSELLGPIPAVQAVNVKDKIHWVIDETFGSAPVFVGRLVVRKALIKKGDIPKAVCEFEPSLALEQLMAFKFHIVFPSAAYELAQIESGIMGPAKKPSVSGIDFCASEGTLYMGVTHVKGKCAIRALRLPTSESPKSTLWCAPLPAELMGDSRCLCSSGQFRVRLKLAGERLSLIVYPTNGAGVPRIVFLWKQTGDIASPVMELSERQARKCVIQ